MDFSELFHEKFMALEKAYYSKADLFKALSEDLVRGGFVKDTFCQAINERESIYPTGLKTGLINLAIPHTDVIHVIKPFVYVVKLKRSLPFIQMGTTDETVEVDTVLVLGIKDPKGQIGLLSMIMDNIGDTEFVSGLKELKNEKELTMYLKNQFRSENK